MRAPCLLLLAACGRVGFDERSIDAAALACGVQPTTSPMLDLSGLTFEYTSFNNMSQPVAGVAVALRTEGTAIGTTTSAGDGAYAITYATGGVSRPLAIEYARTGYFTTTVFTDSLVDRSIAGPNLPRWQLGDAPVWSQAAMTSVYNAAGEMLDAERGTLNVAVRDCAGNGVEGVVVTIDPPPEGRLAYQDVDGTPSLTRTTTVGPYNHVLAYRAQAGRTTITASADGRTFATTIVDVRGGSHNTLAIVRAID